MSDEHEPPELRDLIPGLTKPSITDAEQRQLYEAAMRGEHPPLQQTWVILEDERKLLIRCPGCGQERRIGSWRGPLTCDGCGVTRRVP